MVKRFFKQFRAKTYSYNISSPLPHPFSHTGIFDISVIFLEKKQEGHNNIGISMCLIVKNKVFCNDLS